MEFTKLSEVTVAESISESANVLVEDGGEVKRTAYSWNTLNGRPFGEYPTGGDTLTWDGNTEGLTGIPFTGSELYYRVSDATPAVSDFANGCTFVATTGTVEVAAGEVAEISDGIIAVSAAYLAFVLAEPMVNGDMTVDAGTYIKEGFVGSFTIPGYTGFPTVVPISESLLPESVKRVVVNVTTEDGMAYMVDKTLNEICALLDAGADVVARVSYSELEKFYMQPSYAADGEAVMFYGLLEGEVYTLTVTPDGASMTVKIIKFETA